MALFALALTAVGWGTATPPPLVSVAPIDARPAGAQEVTIAPEAANAECDREASLRPGPQPSPGAMPPGSTMAAIAARGRLIVGVDQNTYPFGSRNRFRDSWKASTSTSREIARGIFGDQIQSICGWSTGQRGPALQSGQVDLVVRTTRHL
jgi:polar amino acid transport system substrate-binding protein